MEKNAWFFHLETTKNFIWNEKLYPSMTKIRTFYSKLGHFFPVFESGQGRSLSPPSSYVSEWIYDYHFIMKELVNKIKRKPESLEEKKMYKTFTVLIET